MNALLEALRQFVHIEYDTQLGQIRQTWAKPVASRASEGEAIESVVVRRVSNPLVILECPDNQSKFRPGDQLLLNRGNPEQGGYHVTLEREVESELIVRAGYDEYLVGLKPSYPWALDRDTVDLRRLVLGALTQLEDNTPSSQIILGILQGQAEYQLDAIREEQAEKQVLRLPFDRDQREAFIRGYSARDYYLVQGPPGTGKTFVLAHLAAALARAGERVLITAFTHRAINNALYKVLSDASCDRVCKIGDEDRAEDREIGEERIPNYEKFAASPFSSMAGGYVVGATCFATRTSRLKDARFDTVIFDEASQTTLPLAAAGMLAGRRFVFFGDHKQMPPVIVGKHSQEWVTRSIFETLFQKTPGTMLTTTRRMNAEITAYPSERFYGGRLHPDVNARDRRLILRWQPRFLPQLFDPVHSVVFAEVRHSGRGMRSPEEAMVAAMVVAEALKCGLRPNDIAVIAPYRAQVRLIRACLREAAEKLNLEGHDKVIVDTVERIQGQERELVVVSLTTSDPGHAETRAEFYFKPNRLNVAITRPRVKLIVIGSPHLFLVRPEEPYLREWVEHFRGLYERAHRVLIDGFTDLVY